MSYTIIEKRAGSEVASFDDEAAARAYVAENIEPDDEWALCWFGKEATDNELLATWGPA